MVTVTGRTARRWRRGAGLLLPLLLTACGGSEQDPDPLVEDFGVAYVARPAPAADQGDPRDATAFEPGADLHYRDLALPAGTERSLTGALTGGAGDVKDVEVSYDGRRLVFAMRLPDPDPDDDRVPTWNLWEYALGGGLRQLTFDSDPAGEAPGEEGGHDIAPHYLPDGRIVFSSTRQARSRAILNDEGKERFSALDEDRNEPAPVLHVLDADGDIEQISYNQSHDLDPAVTQDGRIVFARWDNGGGNDAVHLYRMYPDGSGLELLYGAQSHQTGTGGATVQFLQPRELPDGRILVLLRPYTGTGRGGDIVAIDVAGYVENAQPLAAYHGLSGPAQQSAAANPVHTDGSPSPGGLFSAAFPLWDGTARVLVSWSPCRLVQDGRIVPCTGERLADPAAVPAAPLYGIYMYDPAADTQRPVFRPQEGVMYTEVVAVAPRRLPDPRPQGPRIDPALALEGVGVLNIRSVYDFDGGYRPLGSAAPDIPAMADPAVTAPDARPLYFLRVVKAVGIPDDDLADVDGSAFGPFGVMREIVAYGPVQPDGSVRVKVPADVPLSLEVLDADGRRLGARHRTWLQVRPGEELRCHGCHDPAGGTSHGRAGATASVNPGGLTVGLPFPNTEGRWFVGELGETMAEVMTRVEPALLEPSADLVFADLWTDDTLPGLVKAPSRAFRYADLVPPEVSPASIGCQDPVNGTGWTKDCRIVVNYPEHIQPIWERDRGPATCTTCHSGADAAGAPQVPAGQRQLDLRAVPSNEDADQLMSYRELLFADNEQAVIMGVLQDFREQATDAAGNLLFETDADGNLVLDAMGNPVPILNPPRRIAPPMVVGSARRSSAFFRCFDQAGNCMDAVGDHAGRLEPVELKLIGEWLDIGAQHYNDPFAVPP